MGSWHRMGSLCMRRSCFQSMVETVDKKMNEWEIELLEVCIFQLLITNKPSGRPLLYPPTFKGELSMLEALHALMD